MWISSFREYLRLITMQKNLKCPKIWQLRYGRKMIQVFPKFDNNTIIYMSLPVSYFSNILNIFDQPCPEDRLKKYLFIITIEIIVIWRGEQRTLSQKCKESITEICLEVSKNDVFEEVCDVYVLYQLFKKL